MSHEVDTARTTEALPSEAPPSAINNAHYLEVLVLAERLHRQFLEVIQLELDTMGVRDINNVRALILLNIGDAEMTASELLWRGCYLGSNVSYNLKKLTESGYVVQERSAHDRRVVIVRNSEKGLELCNLLKKMNARHLEALAKANFREDDLDICRHTLRTLQQFWSRTIQPARLGMDPRFG
ncbi:MAG: winged helix DNA-binding protein [Alphaproteobacteria bacterium]|jgi:DNA-binding MarR family transcriptional regulator|nr:winged helix DNA-binding protein [Alphaproteobacteria bacterium]